MKKYLSVFLIVFLIISCVSCFEKDTDTLRQYTILEVGTYDYTSGANHSVEIDLQTERSKSVKLIASKKIHINGEEIKGEYESTAKTYLYHGETETYVYKKDSVRMDFSINTATNRCDSYSWIDRNYIKTTQDIPIKSRENCLQIAQEYLSQYVSDVSSYTLVNEKYLEIPEYKAIYNFEFVRKIDGMLTSDKAYIGVTEFGKVISHLFNCLEEMKKVTAPDQATMGVIQEAVDKKLETIYANIKGNYTVGYTTNQIILSKMANGKLALEYYVEANLNAKKEAYSDLVEMNHLIVYLE